MRFFVNIARRLTDCGSAAAGRAQTVQVVYQTAARSPLEPLVRCAQALYDNGLATSQAGNWMNPHLAAPTQLKWSKPVERYLILPRSIVAVVRRLDGFTFHAVTGIAKHKRYLAVYRARAVDAVPIYSYVGIDGVLLEDSGHVRHGMQPTVHETRWEKTLERRVKLRYAASNAQRSIA
jgi:hypothetical protein